MATLESNLKEILHDTINFAQDDLKRLIVSAKKDSSLFIKNQAKRLEEYIASLAKGEITKEIITPF